MLPAFANTALLLDLDGTLLDFAPAPDLVIVPPALPDDLRLLRDALGGALAIISGRPVAQVDGLLPGVATAVAGEHGAALRPLPGAALERADLPQAPDEWRARAAELAASRPGAMLERKARGFVLHYRNAPHAGAALEAGLRALLEQDARFELMPAAMAWEIRPRGVDKGVALRQMMARPPFAGRLPLFIGDDVTDEDAIRAAQTMGGEGLLVADAFGGPPDVRAWLGRAAAEGRWPA